MEIVGSITSNDHTGDFKEALTLSDQISSAGALSVANSVTVTGYSISGDNNGAYRTINFKASSGWIGSTSANGSHTHTIGNTGSGLPLNIMPPYKTVYMWRRTA
jgi:hypothetical protein